MFDLRLLALLGISLLMVGSIVPPVNYASAHNNLNSEDQTIGNYEVQVATDPEIPTANQHFKLSFRVLNYQSATNLLNSFDTKTSEVDHFRMGARIYYNDNLVGTIPVQSFNGGEWSTDYVFHESGNHILILDLYDVGPNGQPLEYSFNITVLDLFGIIFPYVISSGGIACGGILLWVLVTRKRKVKSRL